MGTIVEVIEAHPRTEWQSDACPFRIDFSRSVLERIRSAAVDAFYSVPRGGVEIGGVLYGYEQSDGIQIAEFRPMDCEHAFGPSFHLSPKDRAALDDRLTAEQSDPALQSMSPVGWYHSHTRSDIQLRPRDVEIYDRYFPAGRQVALVIRPMHLRPARAGFFFRDETGRIETAIREFAVECSPLDASVPSPAEAILVTPPVSAAPSNPAIGTRSRGFARQSLVSRLATLLIFIAGLGAGGAVGFSLRPADVAEPLGLSAVDIDGKLLIFWNRLNPALRASDVATLEVREGEALTRTPLSRQDREQGFFRYDRRSERIDVLLTASRAGQTTAEESGTFAGRLPQAVADPSAGLRMESEALRLQVELKDSGNRKLQREINSLRRQLRDQ